MVGHDQQPPRAAIAGGEEHGPHDRPRREAQACLRQGRGRFDRRALPGRGQGREIDLGQGSFRRRRIGDLPPAGILGEEPVTESVVVLQQPPQGLPQDRRRQGLQDVEQDALVEVAGIGEVLLEEPELDRGQRHRPAHRPLLRQHRRARPGDGRQPGDRLILEQMPGVELQPRLIGPGEDLQAQDGVAAQVEEVVVDADPVAAEHLGPDLGQQPLGRAAGRHEVAARLGGRSRADRESARRSTLPLGRSGRASSGTNADGTKCARQLGGQVRRSSPTTIAPWPLPSAVTT